MGTTVAATLPPEEDRPGVPAPPPVFVFVPLLALLLLELVLPTSFGMGIWRWIVGGVLLALGIVWNLLGAFTQKRAGTDFLPDRPSKLIVSSGPYAVTRNPMYVGFLFAAAGIAVLSDSWLGLLAAPIGLVLLDRLVVAREERYLERKFGSGYLDYKRRVRRWL